VSAPPGGDGDGRTLGAYQLLSQLAVGGMAEIYVARTHGVGGFEKQVALKVIHPNFSADPDFVQMLVDEAKLSVQLQHANIVQTFDLGRVDEQYYIAMELIDGVDLYKLLRRASEHEVDFPFEVAAFIAAEVCAGLDYAHRKRDDRGRPLQIVHRDVSPQNILVSFDGEVKIVDFGIAKAAMRGQQTAAGVIKGKYYYMSPEQAWGDKIDARTDIFSAGILLYEMLVGQMLYMEEDIEKLLDVVRKANIPPPSSQRMGVPRELEQIVMRALKKRADDRWPSAGELSTALAHFLRGFAPDFSRARLATFVREVMGDDPTSQRRDGRSATTHALEQSVISAVEVRDEHSLLFKLKDVKPEGRGRTPTPGGPRRADVATNVHGGGGFEENDATIVDTGDTLMGRLNGGDSDATRPAGLPTRRSGAGDGPGGGGKGQVPSGKFDLGADDPAADDSDLEAPTLSNDDDDQPTGARELPRETRRVEAPLDDEDDPPTPDEIIEAPRFPGAGGAEAASPSSLSSGSSVDRPTRELKPTPLGIKVRHPNAPQPLGNTQAATTPMAAARPAAAQANAPHGPIEDADTRERTRPAQQRARTASSPSAPPARGPSPPPLPARPPSPGAGFGDEGPEPTVAARGRAAQPAAPTSPASPPATPMTPAAAAIAAAAAETVTLPPSQNPVAARAPKQGFDEPTRIPQPQPPPLDSGRYVPGFDDEVLPFPSPLGDPEPRLRARPSRGVWVGVAIIGVIAAGAVALLTMAGGGDARGTLTVVSLPPGADVRIDGTGGTQQTPLTLADIDLRQTHHVRVSKAGYDLWESDVKFPAGEREVRVQAVLVPIVGTVEISSTPAGAEAIVNGRIRGITPTTVGDLPPNDDVVIELRLRGYKVAHNTVSWSGKRKLAVSIPLEKAK
jgi:serine/threonine protein kinase